MEGALLVSDVDPRRSADHIGRAEFDEEFDKGLATSLLVISQHHIASVVVSLRAPHGPLWVEVSLHSYSKVQAHAGVSRGVSRDVVPAARGVPSHIHSFHFHSLILYVQRYTYTYTWLFNTQSDSDGARRNKEESI